MDDPDADMKSEAGVEGEGVKYQDPLLVPTSILLARREVASRYPQATVNHLHRVTEETLVYRKYSQTSCQLPGAPKSTFLMVFSPDGSKVASTHGDHNIYVSEVKTGHCICTLEGHPRTPWCVAFHPASNEIIASGCLGGEVRVWDLKGGSEVWTTEKDTVIASLAFHPTDQVLVIATYNEIYFWDWFQPEPFASISTGDEKEKVRYVKFDPLGHKLITGIANTIIDRSAQGCSRISGTNSGPTLTRLELVAREIRLSHRYNQLSTRFRDLMSRYEALTSTALNNNNNNNSNVSNSSRPPTSRVDRGTDPIDPPPTTLGQHALLNQPRQFVQQATEERRSNMLGQDRSREGNTRISTWASSDVQSTRESQTSSDINLRLEEDYGLSAVRTLRQIISDDSASSSSLDSSSSATSGASGVSERNTRLSLLWTSRLQRPGQDSDSAGESSTAQGTGDTNPSLGSGESRLPTVIAEGTGNARSAELGSANSSSENTNFRGSDGQLSDEEDIVEPLDLNLLHVGIPQPERSGSMWGYFSSQGGIHTVRNRVPLESSGDINVESNNNNNRNHFTNSTPSSSGCQESGQVNIADLNNSESRNSQSSANNGMMCESVNRRTSRRGDMPNAKHQERNMQVNTLPSRTGASLDPEEDLAIPGPSGLSGLSRSLSSLQSGNRYPNSSTIDPQFGVQLLSGHIENMQRICRAHLEITRHRHEIRRLQQIRSMLYDIQHQIHSLRASVDQSIEDLSGSLIDMSDSTTQRTRGENEEEDHATPSAAEAGSQTRPYTAPRHWPRMNPRSVARLQRGPFGTRTRSRHAHGSLPVSPMIYRRIPRLRLARTRFHFPGVCTLLRGTNGAAAEASGSRLSPSRGTSDTLDPSPADGAIGSLSAAPADQRDAGQQQSGDIEQAIPGDSSSANTRTYYLMRYTTQAREPTHKAPYILSQTHPLSLQHPNPQSAHPSHNINLPQHPTIILTSLTAYPLTPMQQILTRCRLNSSILQYNTDGINTKITLYTLPFYRS
ncbi:WD domain, G-beta repeat [Halocaridina rubra]|uniref:WD domain, G-beta repeat n=1 Tax=Halocaridina rubra TaxID=373956 RepID=A0AAN8ZTL7_HALRR